MKKKKVKNLSLTNSFGIYKIYHHNGNIWQEINYIDDKINGIFRTYNKNGQLIEEKNYIDDVEQ